MPSYSFSMTGWRVCLQIILVACFPLTFLTSPTATSQPFPSSTPWNLPSESRPTPAPTPLIPIPTPQTSRSFIPAEAVLFEPAGCRAPVDDYTLLHVNGYLLNKRTYLMLSYAAQLYHGSIDITGAAITQGSYTDAVAESFGTHAGGGAVDLSMIKPHSLRYEVLSADIEPLIRALRTAGFAAWYRDLNEVAPGSSIHIHAIAIGDKHLSQAARLQIEGPFGYFAGYNGLPPEYGGPAPDAHGGPIFCRWMAQAGYRLTHQACPTAPQPFQSEQAWQPTDACIADSSLTLPARREIGRASGYLLHYTVIPGDTLFAIANRYATTLAAIISANHLTADIPLQPGQTLILPVNVLNHPH